MCISSVLIYIYDYAIKCIPSENEYEWCILRWQKYWVDYPNSRAKISGSIEMPIKDPKHEDV